MRQRSFIVVAVALAVLIVGTVGVYAYDKTRSDKIANGVTAGGVDLSGLHPAQARQKLETQLAGPLRKPVTVRYAGHRYRISARRARVQVNVDSMVDRAVTESQKGNVITRTTRSITGGSVHASVPVTITYSKPAVRRFAAKVKAKIDQDPRDANIDATGGQIVKVDSRDGREVDSAALQRQIGSELVQATSDHRVKAPVQKVKAKVTTEELAQQYPRVITINRGAFKLTLYHDLKPVKTYTIAVGRQGLETPAGRYNIQDKQVNPSWHVPNSAWAGALAGRVIPPGPDDPIKARWMGIAGGAGIHGTDEVGSLGSAASHGCIRMAIPDVEALFDKVEVGDPVFIA
jgi:lipoprotein-anchoring transpeptidase ErfK/SrfK